MYDPIHDCYTSVGSDDKPPSSPTKPEDDGEGHEQGDRYKPSDRTARLKYEDDASTDRHGNVHSPSRSRSPERKRKRDFSPHGRDVKTDFGPNSADRDLTLSDKNGAEGLLRLSEADDQERKRLRRYEGDRERSRRMHGQEKEARAGAYARREMVSRDDQQPRGDRHDRNDRGDRHDRSDRRNSTHHHRRSPPQFKYRDAPPPPHLALGQRHDDPDPERMPERPRSPPKRFKRPGARYNQREREEIHKKQQQQAEDREKEATSEAASRSVDDAVRSHYNAVPERGKDWRKTDSKIRGLRSFNNWVKSALVQKFSPNEDFRPGTRCEPLKVLDIGCGKGGDLLKWKNAPQPVELYVGVDTADVSISQAKERFVKMKEEDRRRNRGRPDRFTAEFFVLDAWSETADKIPLIREVGIDLNVGDRWGGGGFDVVSLMFCMHYAFESEEKIRGMLRNVSGALRRGGRFIGTIPSSDKIYEGIKKDGHEFGNSLYKVSFPKTEASRALPDDGAWRPAWGWKYSFFLAESVEDVPEYVVPWEAFRALAYEYNLRMEYKRVFEDIWEDEQNDRTLGPLSERMGVKRGGQFQVQTEEWEACKIYMGFCFRKM